MIAPMRNAARAHVHGKRNAGTMNMQKPVPMPAGGMRIFFSVTAVRASRTRQTRTASAPKMDVTADVTGEICMSYLNSGVAVATYAFCAGLGSLYKGYRSRDKG